MRDFTLTIYKNLLVELSKANFKFVTFTEYIQNPDKKERTIILRHDVDRLPEQALQMAKIEHEMGAKASYYFRVNHGFVKKDVVKEIFALGHEIGYHYETMDTCKGNLQKAWDEFKSNLAMMKVLVPVTTICRHGSPRSKWDNAEIWKSHDYKELGIIAEPYFDVDFNEVMYLTDTGRRWDGDKVNIRDKVKGDGQWARGDGEDRKQKTENRKQQEKDSRGAVCDPPVLHHEVLDNSQESVVGSQESVDSSQKSVVSSKKNETAKKLKLHSTNDIIRALESNLLPDKIMLSIHPQRWNDRLILWAKELVWQNVKNGVKYFVARGSS